MRRAEGRTPTKRRTASARRRTVGAYAVVAAVSGVIGSAVAVLLLVPATPETLVPAGPLAEVPVSEQPFEDSHPVEIVVEREPDTVITSPVSGRVTRSQCRDGAPLESGASLISVDGRPLLTLATAVPLWRELRIGDMGEDVSALQNEIARLGETVAIDGKLGAATIHAAGRLFAAVGDDGAPARAIESARVLWAPDAEAEIGQCRIARGSVVNSGDEIATVPGAVVSARVPHLPDALVEGERVVRVGDREVTVSGDGMLVDTEALTAVLRSGATVDPSNREDANQTIGARIVLREPHTVSVVPPSSVYAISGSEGCVESRGAALAVRVVGSQLGQTYVVFDGAEAPRTVSPAPKETTQCR